MEMNIFSNYKVKAINSNKFCYNICYNLYSIKKNLPTKGNPIGFFLKF